MDTEAKTLVSTIDGEVFEGFKNGFVETYNDFEGNPKVHASLHAEVPTGKDDIKKSVQVSTAENKDAQESIKQGLGTLSPDKTIVVYEPIDKADILEKAAFELLGKQRQTQEI